MTPETTTEFEPAVMEPLVVPPMAPAFPFVMNEKAVVEITFAGLLLPSCACTVTLKPLPAVGDAGEIFVIVSFVGVAITAKVLLVAGESASPAVTVAVMVTPVPGE